MIRHEMKQNAGIVMLGGYGADKKRQQKTSAGERDPPVYGVQSH